MSLKELLKTARSFLLEKNFSEAINICQNILVNHSRCLPAYKILGEAYTEQGEIQEAIIVYTKALEIKPVGEFHAYLGWLYTQQKWWEEAAYQYKLAEKLGIKWPELYYNFGLLLDKLGYSLVAVEYYQKAIAVQPSYQGAHIALALAWDNLGEYQQAIATYQKLIDQNTDEINAYNNLGCVFIKQGNFDQAIAIYQRAIARQPDNPILYNNLGQALSHNEPEEAIQAYKRAIELDQDFGLPYYNLGKLWQKLGKNDLAIECFAQTATKEQASQRQEVGLSLYYDWAHSLLLLGEILPAMNCLREAIAQDYTIKKYCDWVETKLIPRWQKSPDEFNLFKIATTRLLRKLLSEQDLTELNITQDVAEIYFNFAGILMKHGEVGYQSAYQYCSKALNLQPDNPSLYWHYGNSLVKQGLWAGAITVYHTGLKLLDQFPSQTNISPDSFYFQLGQILEKEGKWLSALAYYDKVLARQDLTVLAKTNLAINNTVNNLPFYTYKLFPDTINNHYPQGYFHSTQDWLNFTNNHGAKIIPILDNLAENFQSPEPITKTLPQPYQASCEGLDCHDCLTKIHNTLGSQYLGYSLYECHRKPVEANHQLCIKPLNNFVADISQGRAWIIPQQSYWQLCHAIAIITPDNYLLADLSRDYPAPLPPCDQHNPAHHQIFSMESLPPLEKIEGKVAVLSTLSGNVYFHWMIDLLPRIEILRRSLIDLAEIDWFVVNSHNLPFQKETLNILGVPAHKILTSDQHPHIQADHLIVPSFANYLGYLPDWGIQFLRETFMTADVLKRTGWPKRIYINRDGAKYRQVLNEEALVKYLEKYGFVSVALETLTLADQIALFAEAEVIITPHGSGLTNTVFCQPGTKIVELFSPHYMRYYYVNISRSLGLKHYYWLGDSTSCYPLRKLMYQNPLTEDIIVDLSSLATVLKMVLE